MRDVPRSYAKVLAKIVFFAEKLVFFP